MNENNKKRNELKKTVAEILEFEIEFDSDLDSNTSAELYAQVENLTAKLETAVFNACCSNVRHSTIRRISDELPNRQCYRNIYSVLI